MPPIGGWDPAKTGSSGSGLQSTMDDMGDYGTHVGDAVGLNNPAGKSAAAAQQKSIQDQQGAEQGVLDTEKQQGQQYYGGVSDAANKYQTTSGANANTFLGQTGKNTDAYTGGIGKNAADYGKSTANSLGQYTVGLASSTDQYVKGEKGLQKAYNPMYGQLTNQAMGNAGGAMTLQQAMNPNNAVEQGVQGMYNQQAQGIQNQGLADYGTMAALGSEATANTMGSSGMPMTGAQMQLLQGANTAQAGQAFANAQNQANQLKMQGLGAGIGQSNFMYGQGQQAQQQALGDVGVQAAFNQGVGQNIYGAQQAQTQNVYGAQQNQAANTLNANQSAAGSIYGAQQGQAQEQFGVNQGLASTDYNTNSGLAGLQYGMQQQDNQNHMGMINQVYGAQQQADIAQAQAANAQQSGKLGAIGSIAGTVGGFFAGGGSMGGMLGGGGGGGGGMMSSMSQGAALGQQQAGLVGQGSGNQVYTTPGPGGYGQSPGMATNNPGNGSGGGGGGYRLAAQPANTGIYDYTPGNSFPKGSPYGNTMNNEDITPGDQNPAHYNPYTNYA